MKYRRKQECVDGGTVVYDSVTGRTTCSKCGSLKPRRVEREVLAKYFKRLSSKFNPSAREPFE